MALPRGFGQKLKEFRASGLSPGDAMRRTWAHFRRTKGDGRERMLDIQRKRAAMRRGNPSSAYDVFLRGKKIDTVFQSDPSSALEVKRSLVEHDGYDPDIRVVKQRKTRKNPWDTYAGGTAAIEGKHSYVYDFEHGRYDIEPPTPSARSYRLYFVNTKGAKGGGLWQLIGDFRSPQLAKSAAKKHAQQWFYFKINPGAAWHKDQAKLAEDMEKRETRPRQRTYLRGMADAHTLSEHESRKAGINPPVAIRYVTSRQVFEVRTADGQVIRLSRRAALDRLAPSLLDKAMTYPDAWVEAFAKRNPRPSAIPTQKLAAANRYVNLIRNAKKRQYGFAYLNWLKGGAVGHTPEAPAGLSVMGAQAVRLELDAMKLWENPRRRNPLTRGETRKVLQTARSAYRSARRVRSPFKEYQAGRGDALITTAHVYGQAKRGVAGRMNPDIGMTFNTKAKANRYASAMRKLGHDVSLVPQQYGTFRVVIHEPKKNPIAVYNPPPGRMIYGQVLAVEARKTNGKHRGKNFRHTFEASSRVALYALPDGSVLLKSGEGKRLWADR